ncbi:SEC-C metal-binding domain-containing protein [Peristeroidobacter soli]|uniref:SEC-C metal-binding domain-containing protein n=1 Tax=Peristeroidobacter soli TaxID=2497877 RepID=UPI003899B670
MAYHSAWPRSRNDPCPCGSWRSFQEVLHAHRPVRWLRPALLPTLAIRPIQPRCPP